MTSKTSIVKLAVSLGLVVLASVLITLAEGELRAQSGLICVPMGWCGCATCNNCPGENTIINCNVSPPSGFQWGGCGDSGGGCTQGTVSCGGYQWNCEGTKRLNENSVCNPILTYCQ